MRNKKTYITFLGHSSALISIADTHILTDPNLSRRIAYFIFRKSKPPTEAAALPPIDLVLISHGHYDHLDLPTLKKLPGRPTIVVPPGIERLVRRIARKRIVTLQPWEEYQEKEVTITAVPAKHFGGRHPLYPRTGYQGYVIHGSAVIYFAGDTGFFAGLSEIAKRWKVDAALLPVGAYEPPPFRRNHMSPEDAVEAAHILQTKLLVPIHWGTFKLSLEPLSEPIPRLLNAAGRAGIGELVRVLEPGETVFVDRSKY
jgi:L-ascorbate metabolism protein UlaG (beta-lactamase superfamily)